MDVFLAGTCDPAVGPILFRRAASINAPAVTSLEPQAQFLEPAPPWSLRHEAFPLGLAIDPGDRLARVFEDTGRF